MKKALNLCSPWARKLVGICNGIDACCFQLNNHVAAGMLRTEDVLGVGLAIYDFCDAATAELNALIETMNVRKIPGYTREQHKKLKKSFAGKQYKLSVNSESGNELLRVVVLADRIFVILSILLLHKALDANKHNTINLWFTDLTSKANQIRLDLEKILKSVQG